MWLPKFPSHSGSGYIAARSVVRCVLLSIAEHDGEFMPGHIVAFRVGCHKQTALSIIARLQELGLVENLGTDLDAPVGSRRGGYRADVKRLTINRARLAELLSMTQVDVERITWRRRRKAVPA